MRYNAIARIGYFLSIGLPLYYVLYCCNKKDGSKDNSNKDNNSVSIPLKSANKIADFILNIKSIRHPYSADVLSQKIQCLIDDYIREEKIGDEQSKIYISFKPFLRAIYGFNIISKNNEEFDRMFLVATPDNNDYKIECAECPNSYQLSPLTPEEMKEYADMLEQPS